MRSDFCLNNSAIDLSNANPAGHKGVLRSTGGYASDSAKAEGSSIVDKPGEG